MAELLFLKLGGSLITDKTQAYSPRLEMLAGLAAQIAAFRKETLSAAGGSPQILLGHGSGSFGHTAAQEYGTRSGVHDEQGWRGFAEVHFQAALLNRHVMEALRAAGLPSIAMPPVASVTSRDGRVSAWDVSPLRQALANGLLPVIYGDVVFDEIRGGTILSTEDLFSHLAPLLRPGRLLLAGQEAGVWADFPARTRLLARIHANSHDHGSANIGAANGADVTGGMASKVHQMLSLVQEVEGLEVTIFSGEESGQLLKALRGEPIGTKITL